MNKLTKKFLFMHDIKLNILLLTKGTSLDHTNSINLWEFLQFNFSKHLRIPFIILFFYPISQGNAVSISNHKRQQQSGLLKDLNQCEKQSRGCVWETELRTSLVTWLFCSDTVLPFAVFRFSDTSFESVVPQVTSTAGRAAWVCVLMNGLQ